MKYLVKNKAWNIIEDYNCDKLLYLLVDRPNEINIEQIWYNNFREEHREYDLPCCVSILSSTMYWYYNGYEHRENDKPSRIRNDGHLRWFINGIRRNK